MDRGRAENIAISPTIEKYAATTDTASAENRVIMINDKLLCLTIRPPFDRFEIFKETTPYSNMQHIINTPIVVSLLPL